MRLVLSLDGVRDFYAIFVTLRDAMPSWSTCGRLSDRVSAPITMCVSPALSKSSYARHD